MAKNKITRMTVLLASILAFHSITEALEFVDSSSKVTAWEWVEDTNGGCIAKMPTYAHNNIYIGFCTNKLPHGRGLIFENKIYSVKMNSGREFSREDRIIEGVSQFLGDAQYIQDFHTIFLIKDEFINIPSASDSGVYKAANYFLNKYAQRAKNDDINVAKLKLEQAKKNTFNYALDGVRKSSSSESAIVFLQKWAGDMPQNVQFEIEAVKLSRLNNERVAKEQLEKQTAENAKRRAEEERQRIDHRNKRALTACNDFYAGFVGRYNSGGLFATDDTYVVRYVNAGVRTVTIEGTNSGNSLKRGEHRELSCIDLLEKTK